MLNNWLCNLLFVFIFQQCRQQEKQRLIAEQMRQHEQQQKQEQQNQLAARFAEQLKQLNEMGFTNNDTNIALLLSQNGNLYETIRHLLNSSN